MDRIAVFVDAGYLFAQGSVLLSGKKLARSDLVFDPQKAVEELREFAERISNMPLLRIYWYDGTSTGPTSQHIALAFLPGTKIRLGFVNSVGEQKGVDSLIVTDMIALARNRAMAEAVLISGDEDLRVGVQQAQEFGIKVHLVGIKPSRGSQSLFLLQEADVTYEWSEPDISSFLSCKSKEPTASTLPSPAPEVESSSEGGVTLTWHSIITEVATTAANEVDESELATLATSIRGTQQIPKLQDGRLLARCRAAWGNDLNPQEKRELRAAFLTAVETRVASMAVAKALDT